jgi:hypothetical protein
MWALYFLVLLLGAALVWASLLRPVTTRRVVVRAIGAARAVKVTLLGFVLSFCLCGTLTAQGRGGHRARVSLGRAFHSPSLRLGATFRFHSAPSFRSGAARRGYFARRAH